MTTISSSHWQYIKPDQAKLPDPRIEIAKHISWVTPLSRGGTTWYGIEPDNYNLAIFDTRPHDFKFMVHQCFYKLDRTFLRQRVQGWISVYVAEERLQTILFNREILKIQPKASWRSARAQPVRKKRTLLEREFGYSNRAEDNFNTEERLYQLGYYENLKCKYFANNEQQFVARLGTPRACVSNYQPEVDSYDNSNYLEES